MFNKEKEQAGTIARHDAEFPDERPEAPSPPDQPGPAARLASRSPATHTNTASPAIAEGHWRLNRARAIEAGIFALGHSREAVDPSELPMLQAFSPAKTWLTEGKNIQLLSQRIQRSIEKHMAELRTLRAERSAARQQAVEEAILLSQLAKSKGETQPPAADFASHQFVFSNAEIEPLIARKRRMDEARQPCATGIPACRPRRNARRTYPASVTLVYTT